MEKYRIMCYIFSRSWFFSTGDLFQGNISTKIRNYEEKDQGQIHVHILSKSSATVVQEIVVHGKEREGEKGTYRSSRVINEYTRSRIFRHPGARVRHPDIPPTLSQGISCLIMEVVYFQQNKKSRRSRKRKMSH